MPVFKTTFRGVSKDEISEKLTPGIYDVIIKGVKHNIMESGSQSLNIVVEALESEGANVGKVGFATLWIIKKGEEELSDFGEKRVKEVLEALEIAFPEEGEFTFDTETWKNIATRVEIKIEKGSKKEDGTYYDDKTVVSRFLTEEEAGILLLEQENKGTAQSAIAKPAGENFEIDILDEEEAKPVKKAAKKPAKKKVAKKAAPVVEETVEEEVTEEVAKETPAPKKAKKTPSKKAAPAPEVVEETTEVEADEDELTDDDLDIFDDFE